VSPPREPAGCPLRRVGLPDTFAEGASTAPCLFGAYGLSTQALIEIIWSTLGRPGLAPGAPPATAEPGEYAPV
jgi:transketolase